MQLRTLAKICIACFKLEVVIIENEIESGNFKQKLLYFTKQFGCYHSNILYQIYFVFRFLVTRIKMQLFTLIKSHHLSQGFNIYLSMLRVTLYLNYKQLQTKKVSYILLSGLMFNTHMIWKKKDRGYMHNL